MHMTGNAATKAGLPARPSRCRGDVGAALAETALVAPVFVVIIFGILEFGGFMRDYLTLANGTQAGARSASIAAESLDADYQILTAIQKETGAMPRSQIQTIVVWHASGAADSVPATCKAGTAVLGTAPSYTGACNVYTSSGTPWWSLTANDLKCAGTDLNRFWCPSVRKYAATATDGHGPPDYVGIFIQIKHPWITGLFGSSIVMTRSTIIKIEPQSRT